MSIRKSLCEIHLYSRFKVWGKNGCNGGRSGAFRYCMHQIYPMDKLRIRYDIVNLFK